MYVQASQKGSGVLAQAASDWSTLFFTKVGWQLLVLSVNLCRKGKLRCYYSSWKIMLSITCQKCRKLSVSCRVPRTRGVGWRKTGLQAPVPEPAFLSTSFSKENECKQNPRLANNHRIENIGMTSLYCSSHCYTWIRALAFFFFQSTGKSKSDSLTWALWIKVLYENNLNLNKSCTEVFCHGSASCDLKLCNEKPGSIPPPLSPFSMMLNRFLSCFMPHFPFHKCCTSFPTDMIYFVL